MTHFHPFGSPVYILENAWQAQQSHNKWEDHSRVGIYLCHSPNHSGSVPLVLNTQTGNVSPQFHCIYDDEFATCKRDAKFSSLWQFKAKLQQPKAGMVNPISNVKGPATKEEPDIMHQLPPHMQLQWQSTSPITTPEEPMNSTTTQTNKTLSPGTNTGADQPVLTTRSGRIVRPPRHLNLHESNTAYLNTYSPLPTGLVEAHLLQPDTTAHSKPHPFALMLGQVTAMIAKSDPDTMYLDEALRQPDRHEFIKAMHKELNDHITRKHWKVVPLKS